MVTALNSFNLFFIPFTQLIFSHYDSLFLTTQSTAGLTFVFNFQLTKTLY